MGAFFGRGVRVAAAACVVAVFGVKRGSIGPWRCGRVEVGTRCRSIVPRQLPDVRNVAACPLVVDVDV